MLKQERPLSGDILDSRYRICNLIQSGGMGAVYRAEDIEVDNRICAVKEMLDSFSTPEERRQGIDQFLSEIQVLESFRHPNIPKVTDHFFLERNRERFYYFVMEFIDGIDLSSYLEKYGAPGLPEKQVIKWAIQVCEALSYLQKWNPPVAHRDIKPSNIILRHSDKRILLIDFGIARVTNPGDGYWIGTPGYAPPEQVAGKPEPASDFYALGASMYELLTGEPPAEDYEFCPFDMFGVKVTERLIDLIGMMLEYDPLDRPENARMIIDELYAVLGDEELGVEPLSEEYQFDEAVQKFREEKLDPEIKRLASRYMNEAHTKQAPKYLDYFKFVLSCPTDFSLVVKKNEKDRVLEFYEKQGILEKKPLGRIDPRNPVSTEKLGLIVQQFINSYEQFKGSDWGGGEGFTAFGNIAGI